MLRNCNVQNPWIQQRADPYVYKHKDGNYYFTASVPTYDRLVLRRSDTLDGLSKAPETVIWTKHEEGIMGAHIWAPELHYLKNKWYIYFSAGNAENPWHERPYVLECEDEDPLTGTWKEMGMIQAADEDEFSFQAFSLDATILENKGNYYYIWAEKVGVGKQISNIYIAKMFSPIKLETVQVLLTTPDYDWERYGYWVNEGPAILKKNGKIYLTYSASDTGIHYCVGMLTASEDADLLDPKQWKKERMPVLATDEELGIYGPGHNCFTEDENEKTIMVFHARNEAEVKGNPLYNPNRHAMMLEVTWDGNGNPVFSFE